MNKKCKYLRRYIFILVCWAQLISLSAQQAEKQSVIEELYFLIDQKPNIILAQVDSILFYEMDQLSDSEKTYLYHIKSDCYYYLFDIRKSDEAIVQALAIMPENFHPSKHIEILNSHGQNLDYLGEYSKALESYSMGIHLSKRIKDSIELNNLYYNMASTYLSQSKLDSSLVYLDSTQQISFLTIDSIGVANAARMRANIYSFYDDYERSLSSLQSGLEYTTSEDPELECFLLLDIANIYYFMDHVDSMLHYTNRAEHCIDFDNYINVIVEYYKTRGNLHLLSKDTLNAISQYDSSALIALNLGDQIGYYHGLLSKFTLSIEENNVDKAYEITKKAENIGMKRLAQRAYNKLAYTFHKTNRLDLAFESLDKSSRLQDNFILEENRQKMESLAVRYEVDKNRLEKDLAEAKLKTKKVQFLNYAILGTSLFVGIISLMFYYNKRSKFKIQKEKLEKEKELLKEINEIESQALRAQMNPHFIFNALNSIKGLIINKEGKEAALYISKFSKLVRRILNNSVNRTINLKEELEVLEIYIQLEKLRFRDDFEYEINIDSEYSNDEVLIPPVLIQPFVENSIWHGFKNNPRKNMLKINVIIKNDEMLIRIYDNGVGRKSSPILKKDKSLGIDITLQRIGNFSRDRDSNRLQYFDHTDENNQAIGTTVEITLPLVLENVYHE